MQEVQSVLVVLLSIGFFILLIFGIAIVFVLFKILSNIRRITQRLDETTENIGEVTKYVGKKVGPAAVSAIGSILLRRMKSSLKRKR